MRAPQIKVLLVAGFVAVAVLASWLVSREARNGAVRLTVVDVAPHMALLQLSNGTGRSIDYWVYAREPEYCYQVLTPAGPTNSFRFQSMSLVGKSNLKPGSRIMFQAKLFEESCDYKIEVPYIFPTPFDRIRWTGPAWLTRYIPPPRVHSVSSSTLKGKGEGDAN